MKIRVEPGRVVRLDETRSTGAQGGVYDLLALGLVHRSSAILDQPGVRRLGPDEPSDPPEPPEPAAVAEPRPERIPDGTTQWGRVGLTLEQAAAMSDEELLAIPGIGQKSVDKIRHLTAQPED